MPNISFKREEIKVLTDVMGKRWVDRVDSGYPKPEDRTKEISIEEGILLKLLVERSKIQRIEESRGAIAATYEAQRLEKIKHGLTPSHNRGIYPQEGDES
jgi:hypothetical protein